MLHIPPDIALFLRPPIGTCVSYNYFYFCIINNLAFVMKTQRFFEVVYEYCLFFRSKITKIFLETTSGPLYVCLSVTWYQSINIFRIFVKFGIRVLYKELSTRCDVAKIVSVTVMSYLRE